MPLFPLLCLSFSPLALPCFVFVLLFLPFAFCPLAFASLLCCVCFWLFFCPSCFVCMMCLSCSLFAVCLLFWCSVCLIVSFCWSFVLGPLLVGWLLASICFYLFALLLLASFLFLYHSHWRTCRRSPWKQSLYSQVLPGVGVGPVYISTSPIPCLRGIGYVVVVVCCR